MSYAADRVMASTSRSHRDAIASVLRAAEAELGLRIEFIADVDRATGEPHLTPRARDAFSVSVPVLLGDGTSFGSLQCSTGEAKNGVLAHEIDVLRVVARLVATHLDAAEQEDRARRALVEDTAVRALVVALETRDGYTGWHSESVLKLCVAVAEQLGLEPSEVASAEQVALLHDIGKIGIPDAILQKAGPLDEDEWVVMRRHPDIGAEMVMSVEDLSHLAPAIAAEHERWDGSGYPRGLQGESIPIESRIVLVCDAYHAMISERPYRQPIALTAALQEIKDHVGTQFCPDAARALLAVADLDDLAGTDLDSLV